MKKRILSTLVCLTVAATSIIGCGSKAPVEEAGKDTPAAETTTEAKTEEKAEEKATETTEVSGDKVTLSIYTQYADDDTKVPYDYALEQLKEAYPNVRESQDFQDDLLRT